MSLSGIGQESGQRVDRWWCSEEKLGKYDNKLKVEKRFLIRL